jgi:hypothetical protein
MNAQDKKQYRDSVFQKIYELAQGGVDKGVRIHDLERETGLDEKELSGINSYYIQKNLLRLGFDYPPGVMPKTGAEYDAARFQIETRIHLTAEGIDYYENGFINPSLTPTVNYNTNFHRENNAPVQIGGSHNTQENSSRAGLSATQELSPSAKTFAGLEETDIRVFKAACEEAIRKGYREDYVYTEKIAPSEMSAEDLADSLELLKSYNYIKPIGYAREITVFEVTVLGFERYAQAIIPGYRSIFQSVIDRVVHEGDRTNKGIAEALQQPLMVVNHILDVLQQDKKLTQFKRLNSEAAFEIVDVSSQLKRMATRKK